jgi:hypothetical protein
MVAGPATIYVGLIGDPVPCLTCKDNFVWPRRRSGATQAGVERLLIGCDTAHGALTRGVFGWPRTRPRSAALDESANRRSAEMSLSSSAVPTTEGTSLRRLVSPFGVTPHLSDRTDRLLSGRNLISLIPCSRDRRLPALPSIDARFLLPNLLHLSTELAAPMQAMFTGPTKLRRDPPPEPKIEMGLSLIDAGPSERQSCRAGPHPDVPFPSPEMVHRRMPAWCGPVINHPRTCDVWLATSGNAVRG